MTETNFFVDFEFVIISKVPKQYIKIMINI